MNEKENLTKSYIYESFKQLLEKNNFDNISVCDVCEKAGVSRMSFYRNFKSKEELTFKWIESLLNTLKENIENLEEKSTYTIVKTIFELFLSYKQAIFSLEDTKMAKDITNQITTKLRESDNVDYMNKTSKYIPVYFYGAITSTMFDWLKNGAEETPDEMARLIASLTNVEPVEKGCKH